VIVVLENKILVYNLSQLKLTEIFETTFNPQGVIGVNASKDSCIIAIPDKIIESEDKGGAIHEGLLKIVRIDPGNGEALESFSF
jgi:hypothetical protein